MGVRKRKTPPRQFQGSSQAFKIVLLEADDSPRINPPGLNDYEPHVMIRSTIGRHDTEVVISMNRHDQLWGACLRLDSRVPVIAWAVAVRPAVERLLGHIFFGVVFREDSVEEALHMIGMRVMAALGEAADKRRLVWKEASE